MISYRAKCPQCVRVIEVVVDDTPEMKRKAVDFVSDSVREHETARGHRVGPITVLEVDEP
jgi:hypothetical protein